MNSLGEFNLEDEQFQGIIYDNYYGKYPESIGKWVFTEEMIDGNEFSVRDLNFDYCATSVEFYDYWMRRVNDK